MVAFTREAQSSQRRGDFSGESGLRRVVAASAAQAGETNSPEILWPSAMNCPDRAGKFLFAPRTPRDKQKGFSQRPPCLPAGRCVSNEPSSHEDEWVVKLP